MVLTTEYWNKLLVNIDSIREDWDNGKNYSSKFKILLMGLDTRKRKLIIDYIVPGNHYDLDNLRSHYPHILAQDQAKYVYALRTFILGKSKVIEEYVAENPANFTEFEKENPFFAALKILAIDADTLLNIMLLKTWKSMNTNETFLATTQIDSTKVRQLEMDMSGVMFSVRRKHKGKYNYKGTYSIGERHIFWLEKQNSDKMQKSFTKNVRIKPAMDILFDLNTNDNSFEIKCRSRAILNTLADTVARRLDVKLRYVNADSEEVPRVNLTLFKSAMSKIPRQIDKDIGICEIAMNRMDISNSAPLIIPKRSGRDIRKTLDDLETEGIIDLKDIWAIDHMKILCEDSDRKVTFIHNKDGTLTLQLDTKNLSREKIAEITKMFEERFGIPFGKPIRELDEDKVQYKTYNLIFSSDLIDKVSAVVKENLDKLQAEGLISYIANQVLLCPTCRKTYSDVQRCPDCGDELRLQVEKVKVEKKDKNILHSLKTRLDNSGFKTAEKLAERTYLNTKKYFLEIKTDTTIVYLYFNDGGNIKKMTDYFKHSHVPIILVNNCENPVKGIDKDFFPQISITNLLLKKDDEFKRYFADTLEVVQTKVEDVIVSSAQNSHHRLDSYLNGTHTQYDEDMLEDDTYNLMRYIFRTGEKWGKNRSGIPVPEGIIGYGFLKKMGGGWNTYLRSIIWDCKFTHGRQFNFGRALKLQGRDYILRSSQSKAIKEHSGQLSAYINFTNRLSIDQYDNFAKKVSNIEGWKGNVVLFDLKALVRLYYLMKRYYDALDKRRSQLYERLTQLFKMTLQEKHYSSVDEQAIRKMVREVLEQSEDIPQLDYEATFLHLEADKVQL